MDTALKWLETYRPYTHAEALLQVLQREEPSPEGSEDPNDLFEGLLGDFDRQIMTAKTLGAFFVEEGEEVPVDASPSEAWEMVRTNIEKSGLVSPMEAAVLAEAAARLDRFAACDICAAVAFLLGARSPAVLGLVAGMGIREGRLREAQELVELALQIHPDRPEPEYYAALHQMARGNAAEAIAALERTVQRFPDYIPAWRLLLGLCYQERRWADLERHAAEASRHHSWEVFPWEYLSVARHRLGSIPGAREALSNALERAEQSVGVPRSVQCGLMLRAASLEEELSRPETAERVYEELVGSFPDVPAVYVNFAAFRKDRGEVAAAEDLLRKGLAAHPGDPGILRSLGELLFEARRDEESFRVLTQSLERTRPEDAGDTLMLLGLLCLRNGRMEEAKQLAEALAEIAPKKKREALVLQGDAQFFQGQMEGALRAYEQALAEAPEDLEIRRRVAKAKERVGGAASGE